MKKLILFAMLLFVILLVANAEQNYIKGDSMYCSTLDVMKMKDPLTVANWVKLTIPDCLTNERYTQVFNKLDGEQKTVFQSIYKVDYNSKYNRDVNIDFEGKLFLFNIFSNIYGNYVLEETIKDIDAEINLVLASGGYSVPLKNTSKAYPIITRWSKYLTLYYIMLNGGVLDVEADQKFQDMCKTIQEELKLIAKGEFKLPLDDIKSIPVISESKIVENWSCY